MRKEEYCSRCSGQKSALHSPSFAYESRELSRARGQENQTNNTQLCFAHKDDGNRRDDKDRQAGYLVEKDLKEGCG